MRASQIVALNKHVVQKNVSRRSGKRIQYSSARCGRSKLLAYGTEIQKISTPCTHEKERQSGIDPVEEQQSDLLPIQGSSIVNTTTSYASSSTSYRNRTQERRSSRNLGCLSLASKAPSLPRKPISRLQYVYCSPAIKCENNTSSG